MTKINQADLKREIEAQNHKDSRKKFHNIHSLRLMLDAAKSVKDTESFAKAFTPSRQNNAIARKLKLGLDVKRGRWVLGGEDRADLNRITRESKMTQANEAVEGKKLIKLLMQALEEGDALKVSELTNQMLSQKVSECLQDHRVMISEQLFVEGPRGAGKAVVDTMNNEIRSLEKRLKKMSDDDAKRRPTEGRLEALRKTVAKAMKEDISDLVKVSNLNRNKDSDAPDPEDELLPNRELASNGLENDETIGEESESDGLDTFRQ